MKNTPELYCSKCQGPVQPIRGIVNYFCPKCGATFLASQIEQALAVEPEERSSDDSPALASRG
jgi:predicted amidophosphoribosyltransferase